MSEHTPGPWKASFNGTCWQIDASMDAVATTQFCYAEEAEANANLLASAPDLLAALKLARRSMIVSVTGISDGLTIHEVRQWIEQTDAAIAKAEGRAP